MSNSGTGWKAIARGCSPNIKTLYNYNNTK